MAKYDKICVAHLILVFAVQHFIMSSQRFSEEEFLSAPPGLFPSVGGTVVLISYQTQPT